MQSELIMCIGAQGSGKSTWARKFASENPNIVYLSTDDIWQSIGPMSDRSIAKRVYPILWRKAEIAIRQGQSVILDATFIKKTWRKDAIKLGRRLGAKLVAHVFKADRETLVKRVQQRAANGGLNVPPEVISEYLVQFEPPDRTEFDEIINH